MFMLNFIVNLTNINKNNFIKKLVVSSRQLNNGGLQEWENLVGKLQFLE